MVGGPGVVDMDDLLGWIIELDELGSDWMEGAGVGRRVTIPADQISLVGVDMGCQW